MKSDVHLNCLALQCCPIQAIMHTVSKTVQTHFYPACRNAGFKAIVNLLQINCFQFESEQIAPKTRCWLTSEHEL